MPRFCASAAVWRPMQTALTFVKSTSPAPSAKPRTVEAEVNTQRLTPSASTMAFTSNTGLRS